MMSAAHMSISAIFTYVNMCIMQCVLYMYMCWTVLSSVHVYFMVPTCTCRTHIHKCTHTTGTLMDVIQHYSFIWICGESVGVGVGVCVCVGVFVCVYMGLWLYM